MQRTLPLMAAMLAGLFVQTASAAEIEVKMLNKGAAGAMVFEPDFIKAEVGDTVRFVPTDKGHNAETIKGMVPEGAEMVIGKINEEVTIEITTAGVWGIRCKPHYGLGMVALIAAGEPVNLEQAKDTKTPPKAKAKFEALFEQAEGE